MTFLENWLQIGKLIRGKEATDGQVLSYNDTTKRFEPVDVIDLDGYIVLDEDDMSSDSDTAVPTQQSTKAYVDTEVAAVSARLIGLLHTTVGGSADEVVTVTGAEVGDVVVVTLQTAGAVPRTIASAEVTDADEVTITFSGDPDDDHIVNIVVVKP